jgi:hypothetical protein
VTTFEFVALFMIGMILGMQLAKAFQARRRG